MEGRVGGVSTEDVLSNWVEKMEFFFRIGSGVER